jgi:type VI secretion system protein VasG
LFGKLSPVAYKALEGATVACKLRGNPYVELVHWVQQIMAQEDSDVHRIVRHFELDPNKLAADMTAAVDRLPRGATAISDLSAHLDDATERGWLYGSLMFGDSKVRTGALVLGMVKTPGLRNVLLAISKQFERVKADTLAEKFGEIVAGSPESVQPAMDGSAVGGQGDPGSASGAMAPAQMGKEEAIKRFCVDLTQRARDGKIDPIIGRDEEIRQCVDILMRRRQNNPILTGEAGVGKTAVVEGFAHRIIQGDVPPSLKDVRLLSLDMGLLQAGASMKGEFEQRLRQVIEEVQSSPTPIIMFIDEAHTLIGAGGAAGTGDAANLLKPALARGTLRTIAATTWAEYKKYFEKDPALTRRFQVIKVEEPSEAKAILMIRHLAGTLEKHHKVQLMDEAIEQAVRLSHRYIPARQLPDKAVSLLDTASARVAISQHAVPPAIDDSRRRIDNLKTELAIIGRELVVGLPHEGRKAEVEASLAAEQERLAGLEKHWSQEKELVGKVLDLRAKLRAGTGQLIDGDAKAREAKGGAQAAAGVTPMTEQERAAALEELKGLQAELAKFQGESPLILPSVDGSAVASVVADWTGIPVGRMVRNEIETVLKLADILERRIIGQRHALDALAKRIGTSRAGLENPNKPIGVFMLAGTSGVGKTETALALAETLYGGEGNMITINMSEFQEAHKVATLMGSPPGYVGYGEGGVLTEAVRRRPYSVVLLDEVEKAHADVHEVFFQVFDKGAMKDSEGRDINFRNTIILLTTNVGSELIMKMCKDPDLMPTPEGIAEALKEPMLKVFPAALMGRMVVVPFYPLTDEMLSNIVKLQLGRISKRVKEQHKVPFTYEDAVVKQIVARCNDRESGGRVVDRILTHTVLPTVSREMLERLVRGDRVNRVHVKVASGGDFGYEFD